LISLDRGKSLSDAHENLDLAIRLAKEVKLYFLEGPEMTYNVQVLPLTKTTGQFYLI